jgi:isoleucyl-tRNA synthetase
MSFPPVSVGKTDYPLRPDASLKGPLAHFDTTEHAAPFRLLDGPPYANGAPHLGHVLNKHLKDAVARAARANGKPVEWRPGWDCHGLPLELAVEKLGVDRKDRPEFVRAARDFASEQASLQSGVFQEQGWSAQWDQPWHTQDPHMEAGTLRVLANLLDKGLLDVRFTAVPWCTRCGSTLSGAEQEEKPLTTTSWVVPFEMEDGQSLLSWTTTPWTLPLHRALVLNPVATYVALEREGKVAWVSQDTADHWASVLGATVLETSRPGASFEGVLYKTPWAQHKVVLDERVLPEAGTGMLHAVPGLSELDTCLGQTHGWELVQHLTAHGLVQQSPCVAQNDTRAGSQEAQADAFEVYSNGHWFAQLPYTTEHAHCWRHHTPLLTRASRQVFLRLDQNVRDRAAKMVDQMEFTPESGRTRLLAAMKGRPDWCLSRQRTWGVPVALFLDRSSGLPHAQASTWMRRVADQMETRGVEAWWSTPSQEWLANDAKECEVERVDDVLDVWFDSGCVPQLVGSGDVVVEGTDQHRGWFQSCLWVAAALDGDLPFKRVATHGFVMGANKQKLSKSQGGDKKEASKAPPWHTFSSDVVRLWALTGTEGADKMWSLETVQNAQSACARLRNVLRFLLSNALTDSHPVEMDELPTWDRYWWLRSFDLASRVLELCEQARVGEAVSMVVPFAEEFSAVALGSWKDRLYCAPANTSERQALDGVLKGCLHAWGKVLEVLMPRARAEAQNFWPSTPLPNSKPSLSQAERDEVEWVLGLREALGPANEALGRQKVAPGARRLAWSQELPLWPGQLLVDALDVGQVEGEPPAHVQPSVSYGPSLFFLGASSNPVCPRCRRAQAPFEGYCDPCRTRCAA